jgi:dihydrofolate synthase/folylpolyglutamate synthase
MSSPSSLVEWLAHCERLHPKTIDLTLERVVRVRERLGLGFTCPVFTVAGTNGKGSTCAMLEAILLQSGYRVGVYTSPHLVHFEERCRIDGRIVIGAALLPHFEAVEAARDGETLTYFEFTTLAILRHLSRAGLDAVVLEVGLGGRLDAVNAIDTDCAILTSIDIDHTDYLGPDRESIGREKAGILRAGRPAIIGDPLPPRSVIEHAQAIGADLWRFGQDFNYSGDKQQWGWAGRTRRHNGLAYPALRGANQLLNASGVLAALEALRPRLPVTAQAVRNGLALVELPGRFQIVPGEPTLVLDVAHNPHAVATLAENLDQMGYSPDTRVVFGAMKDKDIAAMIGRLLPLVDAWHFCDLPTARAASAVELAALHAQALAQRPAGAAPLPPAVRTQQHADPRAALLAALEDIDPAGRIIVFGSFYTVGAVLENGLPRRSAKHLG